LTRELTIAIQHVQTPHPRYPDELGRAASPAPCPAAPTTSRLTRSTNPAPCSTAGTLGRRSRHLVRLQEEYRAWLDNLPPNLESSALAGKLQTIVELDLAELAAVDPPRGYGRD